MMSCEGQQRRVQHQAHIASPFFKSKRRSSANERLLHFQIFYLKVQPRLYQTTSSSESNGFYKSNHILTFWRYHSHLQTSRLSKNFNIGGFMRERSYVWNEIVFFACLWRCQTLSGLTIFSWTWTQWMQLIFWHTLRTPSCPRCDLCKSSTSLGTGERSSCSKKKFIHRFSRFSSRIRRSLQWNLQRNLSEKQFGLLRKVDTEGCLLFFILQLLLIVINW